MKNTKDPRPRHPVIENDLEDLSRSARQPLSSGNQHGSREVLVEPGVTGTKPRDETVNILSARHKTTDNLIESLQRALREQAVSRMAESKQSTPYSRLSGARASRIGRRHDSIQMDDKLNNIDEFTRGIEREVDSLTEVREAIDNSKERNLENLRKYVKLSEEIIGDAYESAAAYSCVAQDIVKQAYESSVQMSPFKDLVGKSTGKLALSSGTASTNELCYEDKRQRLIDLYLTGKVSENQLDKLLLMVDSSVAKDNLV